MQLNRLSNRALWIVTAVSVCLTALVGVSSFFWFGNAAARAEISLSHSANGDLTDDGKVNEQDVERLRGFLVNGFEEAEKAALDMNGDGNVNAKDVATLWEYVESATKPTIDITQETPIVFAEGFVTSEITYIETEYVIFEIDPNIYVIGDLAQKTDAMCAAMEEVSGLSFKTTTYGADKIYVKVDRNGIENNSEYSGYIPYAESGSLVNLRGDVCSNYVYLNPGDLLLGNTTSFLHEMSHALRFCQTWDSFGTVYEEGFATYVEYETAKYLATYHADISFALQPAESVLRNTAMDERLYSQTMEFWLAQNSDYYRPYGNDNYAIGHRFFAYVKDTYGECTSWMAAYCNSPTEDTVSLLKSCYGNEVLTNFYPWMKQHEQEFAVPMHDATPDTGVTWDLRGFAPVSPYPEFYDFYNETAISRYSFYFNDLYINIEEARNYLTQYKGYTMDAAYLALSDAATVCLFDKQGNVLDVVNGRQIPLNGVGYIKLVGSGYMGAMEIAGYYPPSSPNFDTPTVIYEETLEAGYGSSVVGNTHSEILMRQDLEIRVEASAPLNRISFESAAFRDFFSHDGVSAASHAGGCRTISLFNISDEEVTVRVIAVKK